MARLYEWESFLTLAESAALNDYDDNAISLREALKANQAGRDYIRRKAVQRARNALNKQLRAAHREKSA